MLPVGLYGVAVYAVNEGVAGYLCVNAVGSDWECEGRPPEPVPGAGFRIVCFGGLRPRCAVIMA